MYKLSLGQVPVTYQNMRDIVGEAPLHNAARGGRGQLEHRKPLLAYLTNRMLDLDNLYLASMEQPALHCMSTYLTCVM